MCGRYWVDSEEDIQEMRAIINEIVKKYADTPQLSEMKTGEIYPTNTVAVVGAGGPELMRWGFPLQGKSIINARSETAFERPMFRNALVSRRVAIPTTGFYEWSHEGGKSKDKFLFRLPGEKMLYLAGMYTDFALPGGWERRYTILTTAANESMRPYHDRMPVYVATSERDVWINDSARTEAILHRAQPQLAATKVDKGGQMSFLL